MTIKVIEYKDIRREFRCCYDQGLTGARDAKVYLNKLVENMRTTNDALSLHNILELIVIENCDLAGLSYWKLVQNLDEENKQLFRRGL